MPSLPVISHPYCRRCGSIVPALFVPALFDPAIQYDGQTFHFSCAMRTVLEKALRPKPRPTKPDPDSTPN